MKMIKQLIVFLFTGSITLVLAACYGTVMNSTYSKKYKIKDSLGDMLPGISLTLSKSGRSIEEKKTDDIGEATFVIQKNTSDGWSDYSVDIADVDGTNNYGNFNPTNLTLHDGGEETIIIN